MENAIADLDPQIVERTGIAGFGDDGVRAAARDDRVDAGRDIDAVKLRHLEGPAFGGGEGGEQHSAGGESRDQMTLHGTVLLFRGPMFRMW